MPLFGAVFSILFHADIKSYPVKYRHQPSLKLVPLFTGNRELSLNLVASQNSPEASLTSDISPLGGAWLHQTRSETCIAASDRPRVAIVVWRSDSYGYFLL